MATRINLQTHGTLVKLSDSDIALKNSAEDTRGKAVVDRSGEEIGKVKDVLIDEQAKKVRMLEVASGGFLGIGETTFLVPVEGISQIDKDTIMLRQERDIFKNAPKYDPARIDEKFVTDTYKVHQSSPWWDPNYKDPGYPTYKKSNL